jgi:transcriptional regulator with XRE-family HTH domain
MAKLTTEICSIKKGLSTEKEEDFYDLFAELDELDPFDVKKEELAAQLAALLSHADINRTEFAAICKWKKSRVTNLLSGDANPTFKTLWEFAKCLGYEADINFRHPNKALTKQPWHIEKLEVRQTITLEYMTNSYLQHQTVNEVFLDMLTGNHKEHYFCIANLGNSGRNMLNNLDQRMPSLSDYSSTMSTIPFTIPKQKVKEST